MKLLQKREIKNGTLKPRYRGKISYTTIQLIPFWNTERKEGGTITFSARVKYYENCIRDFNWLFQFWCDFFIFWLFSWFFYFFFSCNFFIFIFIFFFDYFTPRFSAVLFTHIANRAKMTSFGNQNKPKYLTTVKSPKYLSISTKFSEYQN